MAKSEKVWLVCITLSSIGIILFWVFGFSGNNELAGKMLMGAGLFAVAALISRAYCPNGYGVDD